MVELSIVFCNVYQAGYLTDPEQHLSLGALGCLRPGMAWSQQWSLRISWCYQPERSKDWAPGYRLGTRNGRTGTWESHGISLKMVRMMRSENIRNLLRDWGSILWCFEKRSWKHLSSGAHPNKRPGKTPKLFPQIHQLPLQRIIMGCPHIMGIYWHISG